MKTRVLLSAAVFMISLLSFGQLTGTKTVKASGGDYPTVEAAIADLNLQGAGEGGVTFNVEAGHTETFTSRTAGIIRTTTGSAGNPIVFQKSGTGANPAITGFATAPGSRDYIICIYGTDYITFDRIDVKEPTGVIEWGYAVLKASGTNGSQHVTIRNCGITLNKTNVLTIGIYSNNHDTSSTAPLTVTDLAGTNSDNKFFGNTISNVFSGILLYGFADGTSPYTYYDQNNELGQDGGNMISNFGGGTTAKYGIYTYYQNGLKIANNIISGAVTGTGECDGIRLFSANNANVDVSGNTVNIQFSGGTTAAFYGIYNNMGTTCSDNTVNINNNLITGCTYTIM